MMALPLLSRVLIDSNPSMQKQSATREALVLEVQFMGHGLLTPVEHQKPGLQGMQGWLLLPVDPGLQMHDCGLALCGADSELAVQLRILPPVQYALAGHGWQLVAGPKKPRSHTQSLDEFDRAGAVERGGQRPMMPPEQYSPMLHGSHGVPADALPRYPGRHTHWVRLVAPMGEVELTGHCFWARGTVALLALMLSGASTVV